MANANMLLGDPIEWHLYTLTDEIIGFSHVIVPDGDIQRLLGQLAVLYLVQKFLKGH